MAHTDLPLGRFGDTLHPCMNLSVQTGSTRPPRDATLAGFTLSSAAGEKIIFLLEAQASKSDARTLEHECEAIVKHALAETEGEAGQRLDGTLKELNGLFKGLLVAGGIDDLHMVAAIVDRTGTLHVSHAGRGEAYLIRNGIASQITEYTSGKPTPAFVHISSGQIEARDVVVCATQRLLRTLTPAQLAQMAQQPGKLLATLTRALEADGEHAALAELSIPAGDRPAPVEEAAPARPMRRGSARRGRGGFSLPSLSALVVPTGDAVRRLFSRVSPRLKSAASSARSRAVSSGVFGRAQAWVASVIADLSHPKRKKRAHLLLLAGAVALLLVIWLFVHLLTFSQQSKTRAELEELVAQIDRNIQLAENQRLMGDMEKANTILRDAETSAKTVIDNESGLFRVEANNLLLRIRSKKEEINNVSRIASPTVAANLEAAKADVAAEGLIGLSEGEFVAYDRQDSYRILLSTVEDPIRVSEDQLILDGEYFPRVQAFVFLVTGNGLVEVAGGEPTTMKTDDPAGWVQGVDMETYLRFLYVLSPENKQIYKYERLNNRYGRPVPYNVNGDLTDAIDMAIDGDVYVLKEGGEIVRLFRGEAQAFKLARLPEGVLKNATKIFKVAEKQFYLLDPNGRRVIVLSDVTATGDVSYVKQYVLEGDQVGELKDLYVDPEEARLYVMDEKRVYAIDIATR